MAIKEIPTNFRVYYKSMRETIRPKYEKAVDEYEKGLVEEKKFYDDIKLKIQIYKDTYKFDLMLYKEFVENIYIFPVNGKEFDLDKIVIESAFEHPNEISLINGTETPDSIWLDENEYLLSEDMIGQIKEIIYKRDLIDTVRETDEIPNAIKY